MRFFGVLFGAVALILPGFAAAQAVPLLPPPSGPDAPPPVVIAQGPAGFPPPTELRPRGPGGPGPLGPPPSIRMMVPGPGVWWKDSEIAKTLELSEAQVGRIEQAYLAHRLRLVDLRADLERQELGLQPLLDADRPEEAKVATQIDLITTARGKLEKEHALMLLSIRRVLSVEQWKRLQALDQERAPGGRFGPAMGPPPVGPGFSPPRRPGPDLPR